MRISPSCLNNLTIKTSEATKLYLTVFDKKKKKHCVPSRIFWRFVLEIFGGVSTVN